MVYHGGEESRRVARKTALTPDNFSPGFKVEKPGKYFAPFGGLIPAAGRLMLAIAETLFQERGMPFMFCDTDSMCPARPAHMSRESFREMVMEVAGSDGWFQPLSPYSDGGTLLALEDVNYELRDDTSGKVTKELDPLYCLVISAKRYVLFNIIDNQTVIRKISGHGLGALRHLDDYDPSLHELTASEHIAAPVNDIGQRNYGDLVHGSTLRMLCDIWRIVIDCFRNRTQDKIADIISALPQLQVPQYTQLSLSSSHLMSLPARRGFQFFATFPAPRCAVPSVYVPDAPFDDHKALCKTTLYANIPPEGVTPGLIEQWKSTKTGLFRRDTNEFPHGLFDPAWRLKLQTVADVLRWYFYHDEVKSSADVGELRRKVVVSLDKHYIGKETSPLDDDNGDTQDDEPITTSSDLVIRSIGRNLQPLIDARIEDCPLLIEASSKLKRGKRLTFAEMKDIKANTELRIDGTLQPRYLKMETEDLANDDAPWTHRIKIWERLKWFGRFAEVSERTGISLENIDFAARYGDRPWCNGEKNIRCEKLDWCAIQTAMDDLSGHTKRQIKLKAMRRKAGERKEKHRDKLKISSLLAELQAADFIVFPTEILNLCAMDDDTNDELEMHDGLEVVSRDVTSLAVEYWEASARKQRVKQAAAARVAKHRQSRKAKENAKTLESVCA